MKTYRKIDIATQVIVILAGITYGIISICRSGDSFIYFYFIAGLWQISSMIVHIFFTAPTTFHYHRRFYAKLVLIALTLGLVIGILFSLEPSSAFFLILYLYGLLWLSPILAFYYLYICWKEYHLIKKRELIHLK